MKIHFEAENETVTIQIKRKESSTAEDDVDKYESENSAIDVLKKTRRL